MVNEEHQEINKVLPPFSPPFTFLFSLLLSALLCVLFSACSSLDLLLCILFFFFLFTSAWIGCAKDMWEARVFGRVLDSPADSVEQQTEESTQTPIIPEPTRSLLSLLTSAPPEKERTDLYLITSKDALGIKFRKGEIDRLEVKTREKHVSDLLEYWDKSTISLKKLKKLMEPGSASPQTSDVYRRIFCTKKRRVKLIHPTTPGIVVEYAVVHATLLDLGPTITSPETLAQVIPALAGKQPLPDFVQTSCTTIWHSLSCEGTTLPQVQTTSRDLEPLLNLILCQQEGKDNQDVEIIQGGYPRWVRVLTGSS
eukprot:m.45001 g.45001  ORF g.45001 m.45001 type:complete len:311 (-) comp12147_c0_seq1:257-1189(-)